MGGREVELQIGDGVVVARCVGVGLRDQRRLLTIVGPGVRSSQHGGVRDHRGGEKNSRQHRQRRRLRHAVQRSADGAGQDRSYGTGCGEKRGPAGSRSYENRAWNLDGGRHRTCETDDEPCIRSRAVQRNDPDGVASARHFVRVHRERKKHRRKEDQWAGKRGAIERCRHICADDRTDGPGRDGEDARGLPRGDHDGSEDMCGGTIRSECHDYALKRGRCIQNDRTHAFRAPRNGGRLECQREQVYGTAGGAAGVVRIIDRAA